MTPPRRNEELGWLASQRAKRPDSSAEMTRAPRGEGHDRNVRCRPSMELHMIRMLPQTTPSGNVPGQRIKWLLRKLKPVIWFVCDRLPLLEADSEILPAVGLSSDPVGDPFIDGRTPPGNGLECRWPHTGHSLREECHNLAANQSICSFPCSSVQGLTGL